MPRMVKNGGRMRSGGQIGEEGTYCANVQGMRNVKSASKAAGQANEQSIIREVAAANGGEGRGEHMVVGGRDGDDGNEHQPPMWWKRKEVAHSKEKKM